MKAGLGLKTCSNTTKVSKSNSELSGPKTNIKRCTNRKSHWRGLRESSGSTGRAAWPASDSVVEQVVEQDLRWQHRQEGGGATGPPC